MLEDQLSAMPTNKAATVAGGTVLFSPLILPAVQEVWPQIGPAYLTGEASTALIAAAISAIASLVVAWFVPDRAGVPRN